MSETGSGYTLRYYYDGAELVGFNFNNQDYFYEKNLQGDITGIYNTQGTLVGSYSYDAWGKCSITYDTAYGLAFLNPFRYRGYYYDRETSLYYLNSRYYDPNTGRFINADGIIGTNNDFASFNLYTYCGNNPVLRSDQNGDSWIIAAALLVLMLGCATNLVGCSTSGYSSADEAAMAFANSIYSSCEYIRHEYSAIIYSLTVDGVTTYHYTEPFKGDPHGVSYDYSLLPEGAKIEATVHTHPNSNFFSGWEENAEKGDIPNARRRELDSYVIGPSLVLYKFTFSTNSYSRIGVANPIKLNESQKKGLVLEFESSWNDHIKKGCSFGCETMEWPTP